MKVFRKTYDVLVAGGGVAGIAAALSASRAGMKTALIEKSIQLGGLATSGNVYGYLPLCDGMGRQVIFGIAEELLHASIKYGPGDVPSDWRIPESPSRYCVCFSPAAFVLALDELVINEKVDVWLDTLICQPIMEQDRVRGVEVENKSGRGVIDAKCVIDATGDADVAYRTGVPCEERDNFPVVWAFQVSLETARLAVNENSASKLLDLVWQGGSDVGEGLPAGYRKYFGTRGKDVSEFVLDSRKLLRDYFIREQAIMGEFGRNNLFPLVLPSMADFRTTRRIHGLRTLGSADFFKRFDDSVGLVADWRGFGGQRKNIWEVPYGTIVPQKIKGLLVAGRCISATGAAWEDMRVIPAAALTGEVAGVAAALAVSNNSTPEDIQVNDIRKEMDRKNMLYSLDSLYGNM